MSLSGLCSLSSLFFLFFFLFSLLILISKYLFLFIRNVGAVHCE